MIIAWDTKPWTTKKHLIESLEIDPNGTKRWANIVILNAYLKTAEPNKLLGITCKNHFFFSRFKSVDQIVLQFCYNLLVFVNVNVKTP